MVLFIQLLILLVLSVFLVFFVMQFFNIFFRGFAPLVSSRPKVIKRIIEELEAKPDIVIYELGCGRAGFLRAARKKYPGAKLVGVEYSFWPYLVAQIQSSLTNSKLKILKKNIFKVELGEAEVIYCYLNRAMMQKLTDKFKQECKPGTQIISYTFSIPGLEPTKVVDIKERKGEKIYFYKI